MFRAKCNKNNKPLFIAIFISAFFILLHCFIHLDPIFYVNTSKSMPRGVYYAVHGETIKAGDYVVFSGASISEEYKGSRPSHFLKHAYTLSGQFYEINEHGLYVNGVFIAARVQGHGGVCAKAYGDSINALVIGDVPDSFDSRYYGPIKIVDLVKVKPFFLIDEQKSTTMLDTCL